MSGTPIISIATPTYRREKLLQRQHQIVLAQSEQNFEWLILDDSPEPSAYFLGLSDARIRYHHHASAKMTIGPKRNWLAEQAEAPIIAHFDDDDYYAPDYLATMIAHITRPGIDIAKLSGWFVYSAIHRKLGYWDTINTRGLHFRFSRQPLQAIMFGDAEADAFKKNYLGYGFTCVYRKTVWQDIRFPEIDFNEDYGFISAAVTKGFQLDHFADTKGTCMQIMRPDNTSMAFPQSILPDFLLSRIFPPEALALLAP